MEIATANINRTCFPSVAGLLHSHALLILDMTLKKGVLLLCIMIRVQPTLPCSCILFLLNATSRLIHSVRSVSEICPSLNNGTWSAKLSSTDGAFRLQGYGGNRCTVSLWSSPTVRSWWDRRYAAPVYKCRDYVNKISIYSYFIVYIYSN